MFHFWPPFSDACGHCNKDFGLFWICFGPIAAYILAGLLLRQGDTVCSLSQRTKGMSFVSLVFWREEKTRTNLENIKDLSNLPINSVHTRCIVKTSGFTTGVCKNRGFH